ncbi:hypothetical protein CVT25_007902 [Psilocybe cyanescens]|uniref:DUF4100 domain-containing protein n=1 Tax=Psilocybe cyanescens TaxID=93625 RepID=A0A409VZ98_PSICY|nr:hypothetical protein CVT25_007902 [Psilocybe cyanescens]
MSTMPGRNHHSAPKFDRAPASLVRFLDEVHRLGANCSLSEQETIDHALAYAPTEDYDLWALQPVASGGNWAAFKAAMIGLYPGASGNRKYSVNDLQNLIEEQASVPMKTQNQFGEYYRAFLKISMFLKAKDRLTDREISNMFFQGFPLEFRREVREQLRLQNPQHHPDDPWSLDEISEAAIFVLSRHPSGGSISGGSTQHAMSSNKQLTVKQEVFDVASLGKAFNNVSLIEAVAVLMQKMNQGTAPAPSGNVQQPAQNIFPRNNDCTFCSEPTHYMSSCASLMDYLKKGWCKRELPTYQVSLPDGSRVSGRTALGRNLKEKIDNWRQLNPSNSGIPSVSANVVEIQDAGSTSQIEEIYDDAPEDIHPKPTQRDQEELEMLETLAMSTQKKLDESRKKMGIAMANGPTTRSKGKGKLVDIPGRSTIAGPVTPVSTTTTEPSPAPQYRYVTPIEDSRIVDAVVKRGLSATVTLTTQELLAISPEVRKQIKEQIQTKRLTSSGSAFNMIMVSAEASVVPKHHSQGRTLPDRNDGLVVAKHVEDLRAIDVLLEGRITVEALMDDGCQIVALRKNLWERLGLPIRSDHQMQMVSANATTSRTVGLLHDLKIVIGGYEFYLQVQVVDDAPYEMLLGRPFLTLTQASVQHFTNGDSHVTLVDPNTCAVITVPTRARKAKDTTTNTVLMGF